METSTTQSEVDDARAKGLVEKESGIDQRKNWTPADILILLPGFTAGKVNEDLVDDVVPESESIDLMPHPGSLAQVIDGHRLGPSSRRDYSSGLSIEQECALWFSSCNFALSVAD